VKLDTKSAVVAVGIVSVGIAGCGSPLASAGSGPGDRPQIKLPSVPTPPDRGLPVDVAFASPELGFVASGRGRPTSAASGVVLAGSSWFSRESASR
jgi:hypothetical protein